MPYLGNENVLKRFGGEYRKRRNARMTQQPYINMEKMTLSTLRQRARELGIAKAYKMNKAELIEQVFGSEEAMDQVLTEEYVKRIVDQEAEQALEERRRNERRAIEEQYGPLIKYMNEMVEERVREIIDGMDLCTGECQSCRWEKSSY